jgi:hypothetical protein
MQDDRVHARMAIVRELFGLTVQEHALGERLQPELADVRELPARRGRRA